MTQDLANLQTRYAELLVHIGVNLQPGQSLNVTAELAHADLARQVAAAAYRAGARYVDVHWHDRLTHRTRLKNADPAGLDYLPDYEIARHRQMLDEGWARLVLVGDEFPHALDDVAPKLVSKAEVARRRHLRFYFKATMSNEIAWCLGAVPTPAWALQVFPDIAPAAAVERLWQTIAHTCRLDQPDPNAAWRAHDARLKCVADFMDRHQIRAVRYVDQALDAERRPATDLTIGLTDHPQWVTASSVSASGARFLPNIPTEEVFTTPHNGRTQGYVRTSKPAFPFQRRVEDAYFRFEQGEVVDYRAAAGQEVLDELFAVDGARRLGEVSLVDARSPINQAGIIFHETLFDENAVSHIAFGEAYPDGVVDGSNLEAATLRSMGVNRSSLHVDVMIGTPTMRVIGLGVDGAEVPIMENGQFLDSVFESACAKD